MQLCFRKYYKTIAGLNGLINSEKVHLKAWKKLKKGFENTKNLTCGCGPLIVWTMLETIRSIKIGRIL